MKKMLLFVFILVGFIFTCSATISADTGPKPRSIVAIKGIEGEYVACFAATKASGPNYDYEDWKEYGNSSIEYNPIMEYEDNEGYKWITSYDICNGDSEISFNYYRPEVFKIVIYKNGELFKATKAIEVYAFSSFYEIDFSGDNIIIKKTYDYSQEIIDFFVRLLVTLVIEVGLFFILRLYNKRNFIIMLIANLVTQIALNIVLNVVIHFNGALDAIFLLAICEFFIMIIESIIYLFLMKGKKKWLVVLYGILANVLSLCIGIALIA